METTRRGFIGRALAGLAALTVPAGVAKGISAPVEGGKFGTSSLLSEEHLEAERLKNALMKANLEEAYNRTHPLIQVDAGVVRATDLSRIGPGEILHIDPHETPFMSLVRAKGVPQGTIHHMTKTELEEILSEED